MLDIIDVCEEGALGSVCPRVTEKLRETQCRSRASEAYKSPGCGQTGPRDAPRVPQRQGSACGAAAPMRSPRERSVLETVGGFSKFPISCRGQERSNEDLTVHTQDA